MAFGRMGVGFAHLGAAAGGAGVGGVAPPAGGAGLLVGETDGLGIDFTYPNDSLRVAKKVAGVLTEQGLHDFLTNGSIYHRTVFDASGTLVWAPHNFILQSENLAASWTLTNLTAPSATQIRPTATAASTHRLTQSMATVAGETYTCQIIVSYPPGSTYSKLGMVAGSTTTAGIDIAFDVNLGTIINTHIMGAGCSATIVPGPAAGQFTITAVNPGQNTTGFQFYICSPAYTTGGAAAVYTATDITTGINIHRVQVCRGTEITEYVKTTTVIKSGLSITYDPVTHECLGLLAESGATNSVVWSTDMTNVAIWALGGGVTPNAAVAPNGRTEAVKLIENTAVNPNGCLLMNDHSGTITGTLSVWAKAAERTQLALFSSATTGVVFDLSSGAILPSLDPGISPSAFSSIQDCGNGWYRCAVSTLAIPESYYYIAVNQLTAYTPIDGRGLYLWGPQLEASSTVPTSYIPTFAAIATRLADNVTALTSSYPWSAAGANSIICEGALKTPVPANSSYYFSMHDGTDAERILVDTAVGAKIVRMQVFDNSVSQAAIPTAATPAPVANTYYKIGMAIALNDFATTFSGTTITAGHIDSAGTLPTLTTLQLGGTRTTPGVNAFIKKFKSVPRRMTNVELQTATS